MAPVPDRYPSTPLIQRPSLSASSTTPRQPSPFIPRKLFLQLLVGTVCIFILTAFFWKLSRFFRSFTKSRVTRNGNTTKARYAKTWYGWVPSHRHEANKQLIRRSMTTLGIRTAWESSRSDFGWVRGDPGQKKLGTYQEKLKRWVPRWAAGHRLETGDAMWNPGRHSNRKPGTNSDTESVLFRFATGALSPSNNPRPTAISMHGLQLGIHSNERLDHTSSAENSTVRRLRRVEVSEGFGSNTSSNIIPYSKKRFTSLTQVVLPLTSTRAPPGSIKYRKSAPPSFSMPCLSQPGCFSIQRQRRLHMTFKSDNHGSNLTAPTAFQIYRSSRRYQVWSARMGLETLKCIGYSTHTLPRGPPGSPQSALLGSLSLDSTAFERAHQYRQISRLTSSSDMSDLFIGGAPQQQQHRSSQPMSASEERDQLSASKWHTIPSSQSRLTPFRRPTLLTCYEAIVPDQQTSVTGAEPKGKRLKHRRRTRLTPSRVPHFMIPVRDWSNWEVRLINNLDRRLLWISDQLTPGQRPFHFALLANHWLNRETWIVYDPISRVPIHQRRRWGDPRFNFPYSAPPERPRTRYLKFHHRPINTPKINSWRLAMNRHRRQSGLREFIKGIEMYGSSADEPPDGKIDPASWILRKPPEGLALSARQRQTYYEGGAGWQERLSDWQMIKRGYRVRKGIHEGRVNRTRAKEIVHGIARYYQQAASKFSPPPGHHCREEAEGLPTEETA
ncbi:hypothetical protein BJX70DRAFT_73215 [Aspergillus crustosus]